MTPIRSALDTSVLVSALVIHAGALSWLRNAWRSGRILPLASRVTAAELIRVLAYPKFALTASEQRDLLDDYLPFCESVTVPSPPPAVPDCRAPFDRPFLELALAGLSDVLVTGDSDLLALAQEFAVPIRSPSAFEQLLIRSERNPYEIHEEPVARGSSSR